MATKADVWSAACMVAAVASDTWWIGALFLLMSFVHYFGGVHGRPSR